MNANGFALIGGAIDLLLLAAMIIWRIKVGGAYTNMGESSAANAKYSSSYSSYKSHKSSSSSASSASTYTSSSTSASASAATATTGASNEDEYEPFDLKEFMGDLRSDVGNLSDSAKGSNFLVTVTYPYKNTNLSITAIANEVGFSDSRGLISLIKNRKGCSPSEFRKR